jgi:hypothetical protein
VFILYFFRSKSSKRISFDAINASFLRRLNIILFIKSLQYQKREIKKSAKHEAKQARTAKPYLYTVSSPRRSFNKVIGVFLVWSNEEKSAKHEAKQARTAKPYLYTVSSPRRSFNKVIGVFLPLGLFADIRLYTSVNVKDLSVYEIGCA